MDDNDGDITQVSNAAPGGVVIYRIGPSSGPPPWTIWKLNHRGGDLQNWAQINGVDEAWALDWSPTGGGIELVGDNTAPPQNPEYRNAQPYSPGNLDYFNSCNVGSVSVSGGACIISSLRCFGSFLGPPGGEPYSKKWCGFAGVGCIGFANDIGCCIKPHKGCDNPDRDFTQMK